MVTDSQAMTVLQSTPVRIPASTPAQRLPVIKAAAKPVTAPMVMVPSTPRFKTPARWV